MLSQFVLEKMVMVRGVKKGSQSSSSCIVDEEVLAELAQVTMSSDYMSVSHHLENQYKQVS